jgi:hypothetical protein
MATDTDYVWELGIDWNAIKKESSTGPESYLIQGLVKQMPTPAIAMPIMRNGETIIFRIFDVTADPPPQAEEIRSFDIGTKEAVNGQSSNDPLSSHYPLITRDSEKSHSTAFEGCFPSWTSDKVFLRNDTWESQRYLLNFRVQADAGDDSRCFCHDPEMVVGPNM